MAEALAPRRKRPSLTGLLVRLGPGPTLLGGPDTGLDDATFARFVRETFEAGTGQEVPGLGTTDPGRFAARAQFLAGSGRMPWLTWRSRGIAALYAELAEAARGAAPGAVLAVATPGLDDGPAGAEARRVDLAGLAPSYAWRAVGLDLEAWPGGAGGPIVLRGVGLSTDDLAHDLATSPDLDAHVAARPARGLLLGADDDRPGRGPGRGVDRPPRGGHGRVALGRADGRGAGRRRGDGARPGRARRALGRPVGDRRRRPGGARPPVRPRLPRPPRLGDDRAPPGPAAVRRGGPDASRRLVHLPGAGQRHALPDPARDRADRPPSAPVDDLGRGLRLVPEVVAGRSHVVLDLPPFGVAAIRVGAPKVELGSVTPYPSEAVIAGMKARYDELSGQLARLNGRPAPGEGSGPPNPGFEPGPSRVVELAVSQGAAAPGGWQVAGDPANTVEIDPQHPHSGRSSLRLDARVPPASAVGDRFTPSVQSSLTVQAWLRADRPDAKVRVWIEGEAAGRPFVRRSELSAGPDWAAMAVRVADLPAEGLDNVRLRFEMMTAGSLWIDDLGIAGETLSEPERLNAAQRLAGGHARLPREAIRRLRPAGRLALDPARRDRRRHGRGGPGRIGRNAPHRRLDSPTARAPASVNSGRIRRPPRGWSPRLAGHRQPSPPRRGCVFVACNTLCFSREPLESALRHIAELEFDKIDLAIVEESPHLRPSEVAENPEAALRRLRHGPSLTPAALGLDFGDVDLLQPGGRRRFEAMCRLAKPLTVAVLTIPAAPLGTPFDDEVRRLSTLAGFAMREGLVLAVETHSETLTADPAAAVALCQAVPGLGLTLDPSHYIHGPHRGGTSTRSTPTSRTSTSATRGRNRASSRSASARARSSTAGSSASSNATATTGR